MSIYRLHAIVGLFAVAIAAGACDRNSSKGNEARSGDSDEHTRAEATTDTTGAEPIQVTAFSEKLELFMEYPAPIVGRSTEFLCHFTILETGQPVRISSLTVEARPATGQAQRTVETRPVRDGIFKPRLTFAEEGRHDLVLRIAGLEVEDEVIVGDLLVRAGEFSAPSPKGPEADHHQIPFLMEEQWTIGMLLTTVERRSLSTWLEAPGRVVSPPHARAEVSSPMIGRLRRRSDGAWPKLGDKVAEGEVLALVESPLLYSAEVAERSFDIRQKSIAVREEVARARASLDFAKTEHARLARLHSSATASEREVNEAERELAIAEAEHEAALALQHWFDAVLADYPEFQGSGAQTDGREAGRMSSLTALTAPISGELDLVAGVEGETVETHQVLFRIIETRQLWITAQVSEFDWPRLPGEIVADYSMPGATPVRRAISAAGGRVVHVGKEVEPDSRTLPITFELPGHVDGLRSGMFVDVHIRSGHADAATAIPESAVVMDGGRPVVFVLVTGESFERRDVPLGIRDRGWIEALSGVSVGERVVSRGAAALKMAQSAPSDFGHGHVH